MLEMGTTSTAEEKQLWFWGKPLNFSKPLSKLRKVSIGFKRVVLGLFVFASRPFFKYKSIQKLNK